MPVPIEFLRGVLGFLGIVCAYITGRTAAALRQGGVKPSRLYAWIIRSAVCCAAVAFRHPLDTIDIAIWSLMAVAFSAALWDTSREKKPEDPAPTIFPDEP
jgi:hypothetical protein